jgi:outer membrane protein TolC
MFHIFAAQRTSRMKPLFPAAKMMERLRPPLFQCMALLCLFPSAGNTAEPAPVYTLSQCLKTSLVDNPALILAHEELAISQARLRALTVSLLPAVSIKTEETSGRAEQGAGTPSFIQRSQGVQMTQPVYYGGKMWADRRRGALAWEVAGLQLVKQRLEVYQNVTQSYWKVVALQQALDIYQSAYEELQGDLEKAARHELSASRSARIELLSTRVQNRECQSSLAETREQLEEARLSLLDAMGHTRSMDFQIPSQIPAGRVSVDEKEALRLARDNRPDLKVAEKMMASAVLTRRIGASAYYPRVDLNGFYGRSGAAFIESDPFKYKKDWNAGVRASWVFLGNTFRYSTYKEHTSPRLGESSRTDTETRSFSLALGDALGVGIEAREAKKALNEEQWRYDKTLRDADREVRSAARRLETLRARSDGAKGRVEEALQSIRDTKSLLQEDRAHLGDMASARNRLASSQAAYANSLAEYYGAVAAMNKLIGIQDYYQVKVPEGKGQ